MQIVSPKELEILREGGHRLAVILKDVAARVRSGVSTGELAQVGEALIFESGGAPSFKGYRVEGTRTPFPASLCISVNDEVVHAIPKKEKILQEGDVVSLDIGMWYPGKQDGAKRLCTDMAITVGVGKISDEAERLIRATEEALQKGIAAARPGGHVGDISAAIETHLRAFRLGIVEELAGHGVGENVHEEPFIPNVGKPGQGPELKEGLVIAIEPIATLKSPAVALAPDGWTYKTKDKNIAAHFEHTIVIAKDGAEIVTISRT